jgi:putative lipoic acid-binding regulatory protein
MPSQPEKSLLEFPCRFPIKAMGRQSDDFEQHVVGIVTSHAELWPGDSVWLTPSRGGNFISVTAVVNAISQQQLDAIYQELTDSDKVLMAL